MASRIKYIEQLKKQIIDEYNQRELSIDALANKYGVPNALVKNWIDNNRMEEALIAFGENSKEKKHCRLIAIPQSIFKSVKTNVWTLAGCFSLLIVGVILINFHNAVIESEMEDCNRQILNKLDSLVDSGNIVKSKMEMMDSLILRIDNELEMSIIPLLIIQNSRPTCNCKHEMIK